MKFSRLQGTGLDIRYFALALGVSHLGSVKNKQVQIFTAQCYTESAAWPWRWALRYPNDHIGWNSLKIISRLVRLGCYALCRTHHHRASPKFWLDLRRCQAVARIADRTASQQTI